MPDFAAVRLPELRRAVDMSCSTGPRQRGGQVSMEPRQKIETTHLSPVQSMNHMLLILKLGTLDTRVARRSAVQTPERSASLVFDCCMHATAL
jgi:hypothetical protein